MKEINTTLGQIARLSTDLRTFHDEIAEGDKRWHLWHDCAVVIALVGIAFITMIVRGVEFYGNWDKPIDQAKPSIQAEAG